MTKRIIALITSLTLLIIPVISGAAGYNLTFDGTIPNTIFCSFTGDPSTTVTLTWETGNSVTSGSVEINGRTVNSVTSNATAAWGRLIHRAYITGLTPDTAYTYKIKAGNKYSREYTFKTAKSGKTAPVTFIHVTDTQSEISDWDRNYAAWGNLTEKAVDTVSNINFFVHTGDMIQNNDDEDETQKFFGYAQDVLASYGFLTAAGNHDYTKSSAKSYLDHYTNPANGDPGTKATYSFDYGDIHFIALNSESGTETSQGAWITSDLAATAQKWKIALIHNGPYGKSGTNNAVSKALDAGGVQLVLEGHNHNYIRTKPIDAAGKAKDYGTVYVQGNAAALKFNSQNSKQSYMDVILQPNLPTFTAYTVYTDRIEGRAYTVNNNSVNQIDSFTITAKPAAPPPPAAKSVSGTVTPMVSKYAVNPTGNAVLTTFHNKFGKAKLDLYKNGTVIKTLTAEAVSGNSAAFSIDNLENGNYGLLISRTGLCPVYKEFTFPGENVNLGEINLNRFDVDGDGEVTLADIQTVSGLYTQGVSYPDPNYKFEADTNGDSEITLIDLYNVINTYLVYKP
jgi:predicted phosphodiesterase